MQHSPLAEGLNRDLSQNGCAILDLLSERGKKLYFPYKGILGQSAEAKTTKINATIGTAFEEDGSPLTLECLETVVHLPSTDFLYAPSFGLPKIREVWTKGMIQKNPDLDGKPFSTPVVTSALTHGLSASAMLFVNDGDSIILPDLYWDNYDLIFGECFNARLETFRTFQQGGFDVQSLRQALAKGPVGKRIVLLNFPNNPAGYTCTDSEAVAITEVLRQSAEAGNSLVVILDDAYFGLVYEKGVYRQSLFARLADAHPRLLAVKLDGPTKEDYAWSLRVGFITFAFAGATPAQLKALESKAAGAVRASISNASGISQAMLQSVYPTKEYAEQKQQKFQILQSRYHKIRELLSQHPEWSASFEPMPFNSGYFMCVKPIGVEAEAVRLKLLESYSTGVIVLSGLLRLAFSCVSLEKLPLLFSNVHAAIQELRNVTVRENSATL
jgi:aspartate/methionine/tyrosine aminotransferase